MLAFKAKAYVNAIYVILFSYGCIHRHPWIRDTSYTTIKLYDM